MRKNFRKKISDSRTGFTPTPIPHTNLNTVITDGVHTPSEQHSALLSGIGVSSQRERGFTLIELLVVISIIALLSSVILAALNTAKAKARDASILADIHTLTTVMELYYDDHGYYPPQNNLPGFWEAITFTELKGGNTEPSFISALSPYLKQLPNPNKYVIDQVYKWSGWGFGWGSGGISRISYNRPRYSKNVIYNQTGIMCDSLSDFNFSNNCYILTVRTETATTLGPAETRIYLIVGKNGSVKIVDTNNIYSWGLY